MIGDAARKPEVRAFLEYLLELRAARMTQKEHFEWLGIGNTKLMPYLKGDAVPDPRVLSVYFVAPFNDKRELTPEEHVQLITLHRAACEAHPPREPTDDDKVDFLKHDLQRSQRLAAEFRKRLNTALERNINDSQQLHEMEVARSDLNMQTQFLQAQVESLHHELSQREADHQRALDSAGRERTALVAETERALKESQRELAELENAVAGHLHTVDQQRAKTLGLEREVVFLKQEVRHLQQQISEDRKLYMHLVNHLLRNGPANVVELEQRLANLGMRHELGERVIAQLSEQNAQLVRQLAQLTDERDRLNEERDFLALSLSQLERPSPTSTTAPLPVPADEMFGEFWK
ncbi:hypothetical protein ACFQU9_48255 [Actinomadura namibiensis]|uniref:Chromosome segregation ATPase n=2 Tax=Actinomadura TaxID=1988 RepID=A0A7W3M0H2_ACTNM|nr:hypothetical protein [Actinomadura namibiensis]MBA8957723.1 chromosome segregation ATPase [Actinomadura namibiensis]